VLETLQNLGLGFQVALAPGVLWYGFIGCLVGTLVGVLPGVGPLAGISLLLPVTYGLDATKALVMLAGIYYGAMYGGSTTSILMRIPGEAASVMTCIDGYAMARKGRAGPALAIAAVGSYVAGTVSVVALMFLAPPLAAFALRFGPPEYFSLLLLGLLVLAYMNTGSMLKGLAMAALGLLLGMIGIDQMSSYFRFAYGVAELGDGIGVVPVAVGLFGAGAFAHTMLILLATQKLTPTLGAARAASAGVALYLLHNVFYALFAFIGGWIADRVKKNIVLAVGYAMAALMAIAIMMLPVSVWTFALIFILGGTNVALEETAEDSLCAELVREEHHGMAFGVLATVNGVGDFLSSVIVGILWTAFGTTIAFGYSAALSIAGALLVARLHMPAQTKT